MAQASAEESSQDATILRDSTTRGGSSVSCRHPSNGSRSHCDLERGCVVPTSRSRWVCGIRREHASLLRLVGMTQPRSAKCESLEQRPQIPKTASRTSPHPLAAQSLASRWRCMTGRGASELRSTDANRRPANSGFEFWSCFGFRTSAFGIRGAGRGAGKQPNCAQNGGCVGCALATKRPA